MSHIAPLSQATSINRIRLEFKELKVGAKLSFAGFVLIESDWNLKSICPEPVPDIIPVLIESDWNLKVICTGSQSQGTGVLIESDWNLKLIKSYISLNVTYPY